MKSWFALSVIFFTASLICMSDEKICLYRFDNSVDSELESHSQIKFEEAKKALVRMEQEDQNFRRLALSQERLFNKQEANNLSRIHVAKLKEIIAQFGWPSEKTFDKDCAHAAWLIAQHADHDLSFQEEALAYVADNCAHKDETLVADIYFAFLFDRIQVKKNKVQFFGTQFDKNGKLWPLKKAQKVDEMRKKCGMMPLEEYEKFMANKFASINIK